MVRTNRRSPSGYQRRSWRWMRGAKGERASFLAMISAMLSRTVLTSLALCVPCLLAGQPTGAHTAHFEVSQGIPLVHIKIDGQGPFAFVLDTGTNCEAIVSPRLVRRLGLSAT